jgi:UDP-3-O-[3-hydroxymyristoyl] glucosamine N-acyltransferase
MSEFFKPSRNLTTGDIAKLVSAKVRSGDPLDRPISNIAPLDTATPPDISFLDSPKYLGELKVTGAGACLVAPRYEDAVPPGVVALTIAEPYRAFVAVARTLFPTSLRPSSIFEGSGRATSAQIHASARLEAAVTVDPLAVIGPRAEIGTGTLIGPGAVIGPGVHIGRDCAIGAQVTILNALIGDRVIVHAGVRIGQDGFGYLPSQRGHQKVPQTRRVIIQDDVEIGANTAIDRGATRDTVIGEGTKIDNLVQIGHNSSIGRHCLIVSQVGISGSVTVGDFAVLAGQVGISDHVTIGPGAMVAAQSGVISDIPAGERWGGSPAVPAADWTRGVLSLRRLARRSTRKSEGVE